MDLSFSIVSFEYMKDVFLPSKTNEYPYICFNDSSDSEYSKFLTDDLYKKSIWYIVFYKEIECAVIAMKIINNNMKIMVFEVNKFMRHNGIGTKIIKKIKNICKLNKISRITLVPRNEDVKKFYIDNGFFQSKNDIDMHCDL